MISGSAASAAGPNIALNRTVLATYSIVYTIAAFMTGACLVLGVMYCISPSSEANKRWLAIGLVSLCIMMCGFEIATLVETGLANVAAVSFMPHFVHWVSTSQFILSRLVAMVTQIYFLVSCVPLYKQGNLIVGVSVVLMLMSLIGAGFATVAFVHLDEMTEAGTYNPNWFPFSSRFVFWSGLFATAFLDIGLCILTYARFSQFYNATPYKQTRDVLKRLMRSTIESYLVAAITCSVTAVIEVMSYATTGTTARHTVAACYAMNAILARVYALTCLYTLVMRLEMRSAFVSQPCSRSLPYETHEVAINVKEERQVSSSVTQGEKV